MISAILAATVALGIPAAGSREAKTVDPRGDNAVTVSFEVPISDIQQMWTPDLMQPFQDRKWWVTKESAPQYDMPYLAFFDMAERNRFSFGSESLEWDNRIESKIDQEKGVYRVKLTVAAGPKGALKPFKVTFDRRPVAWTRALADWRESLGYPKGKYPEAAWRPVYCSWYAVHAAVTQDWTERTAAIAADLGFGTFILDDGWSYDEAKRVNPETIKTWYRDVGEWTAFSKAKFPDFRAHRERMRKTGLKYIVWTAPYFLGTRSPAFTKWGYDKRPDKPFEGNVLADITDGPLMESVTEQLVTLLKTADLDGLKIDFLDYVAPSVDKPRGAASLAYIEDLMKRLREVKPDGLYEFRASYATPVMAHLGTQFRAGDVPFEWLANLMRLAQIRITMGDGIPVHADPIYWSDTETDDNVDRHFMAAMAGVPMLSMDLEKMAPARRATVRAWLDYYTRRVEKFQRGGKWEVAYRNGGLAYVLSRLGDETLAIVNDADAFAKVAGTFDAGKAVVFNLGFGDLDLPNGVRVGAAKAFPAVAAAQPPAAAKELRYFNVVPIRGGDVEFAAREVKRQAALGIKAIAVSLSYHPQCTPAANLLPVHAEKFRRLKALLADTDVEVGVLVQSTAGHGWNGRMQLSHEPWQRSVHTSGFVGPRYCQLDPGFRAYILEAVRSICREGPSFLLIDDDFGPRGGEGFCPLHVALYNAATGETRTAAEWGKLAEEGELSDPVRRKMEEARRQVPIAFAREIRKAIDSVDPRIRCGMCTPGKGMGFTREVALALAGPDTKPFIRVCNAVYGIQHPTTFINQFKHVRQLVSMFDGVEEIVAEADTWPQNYWSEPARFFSAHLIFDVLFGLDGAKIWMSEFERAQDVGSQARYERVFRDELPKRQALYDLMRAQHPRFHGVTGVVNWEDWSSDSMKHGAWNNDTPAREVFMPFGFPCEFAKPGLKDPRNVYALTRADVQKMTDDEVRAVLAHRAYVDAAGAKELTKRGFAKLIGVEATDGGEDFFYNCELPTDGAKPLGMMWTETSACLKPLSDKVEILSEFAYRDPFMKHPDRKAPALTYFRNALGGEVAVSGWTFENGGWNAWARYLKVARKEQLVKVMDRLAGGFMPFVACENNHAISTWATLDNGSALVTLTNLAVDDWQDLRVRLDKVPASAKLLRNDGAWREVEAEKTGADEVTFRVGKVRCLEPQILMLEDK